MHARARTHTQTKGGGVDSVQVKQPLADLNKSFFKSLQVSTRRGLSIEQTACLSGITQKHAREIHTKSSSSLSQVPIVSL